MFMYSALMGHNELRNWSNSFGEWTSRRMNDFWH